MKEYAKDFYQSAAWKRARQTVIKRANGLCERCKAAGQFVPGVIVHHKEYITPNGRYRFGSDGRLLPPMQQDTPRGGRKMYPSKEPRELPQKNSARSHAYEGG